MERTGGPCNEEQQRLEQKLQVQMHSLFLTQRSTVEQTQYQRLKKDLLKRMRQRRKELGVIEKVALLRSALSDYDSAVRDLKPFFVDNPERDAAERRLNELQGSIGDSSEAKDMKQRWKMEQLRRMPRQNRKFEVSPSLGLRLMVRPAGLGNFQFTGRRQVGPMSAPNEVAVGVVNDGNVMDVYNKKPSPPLIKFQPVIGLEFGFS